jgi:hypothetical protein
MKKLALALSILVLMCGCGNRPPSPLIVVSISPNPAPNIDQGQTLPFTASLASNTPGNTSGGVTWTATGPGCSGAACGTFINVTSTSATYLAPPSVSASLSVTVTATSVSQTAQSASSAFTVFPPPSIVTTALSPATPNYVYHTSLEATGGVPPLNWSLASGTLPAGMTLNTAGVLFGTPTTGSTSTFTVKVTDSSTAPGGALSAQQTLSLTVISLLSVPAGALPNGTVGFAYSAPLPSIGGVPPLAWSIFSGNLPSGLVLQKTGVISGTPTVSGTYEFAVTVVDSSPVQQTYTSSDFSITINPAGPLTIRTTGMLDGTVDTPYQGQLVATGGTPPLAWVVTAGALPTGLALNPETGAITGLPTAAPGTYAFTVQVSDASTPQQTSVQALSITINAAVGACSSSGNNSVLLGQYAFSLRGYNGSGFIAVVGSFTADGSGNVTAGEADTNGVLGAQYGNIIPSASSYSVGPDNRGCATLATPFGTFHTRFAVGNLYDGAVTAGRIMEFDPPGSSAYIAAGPILQQNEIAFLSPLTGSYELQTAGWDSSTSGRYACVGIVSGASNKFSYLQQDCNDDGTVTNTVNVSTSENTQVNTYSAADTNGRGTGIHSVGQGTSTFTFYWVSTTQLLIVNSDPSPTFSGVWQQENVPSGSSGFNQASFRGNVAFYSTGLSGASGDVAIATETADGVSTVTSHLYRDVGGAFQNSSPDCTYSIIAIGRLTLTGAACEANPPISYMNAFNTAFVLGTDPAVELGAFEPQAAGISNPSLAGTYYLGTSEIVSQAAEAQVGVLTLTATGLVTSTTDTASTLTQVAGTPGSDTYTVNADGTISTGSSGGATVGVAISGTRFVIIGTPTFPTLQVAQQ